MQNETSVLSSGAKLYKYFRMPTQCVENFVAGNFVAGTL